MGLFGRKNKQDDEAYDDVEGLEAAPADETHDPSSWALPADAAVAAGQDTVEQDPVIADAEAEIAADAPAPATAAGGAVSGTAAASPSAGLDADPGAVAAAQAGDPEPEAAEPEPDRPFSEPAGTFGTQSETGDAGAASAAAGSAAAAGAAAGGPAGAGAGTAGGPAAAGLADNPTFQQRPELLVAGAFAGAFLVARVLKRIVDE